MKAMQKLEKNEVKAVVNAMICLPSPEKNLTKSIGGSGNNSDLPKACTELLKAETVPKSFLHVPSGLRTEIYKVLEEYCVRTSIGPIAPYSTVKLVADKLNDIRARFEEWKPEALAKWPEIRNEMLNDFKESPALSKFPDPKEVYERYENLVPVQAEMDKAIAMSSNISIVITDGSDDLEIEDFLCVSEQTIDDELIESLITELSAASSIAYGKLIGEKRCTQSFIVRMTEVCKKMISFGYLSKSISELGGEFLAIINRINTQKTISDENDKHAYALFVTVAGLMANRDHLTAAFKGMTVIIPKAILDQINGTVSPLASPAPSPVVSATTIAAPATIAPVAGITASAPIAALSSNTAAVNPAANIQVPVAAPEVTLAKSNMNFDFEAFFA